MPARVRSYQHKADFDAVGRFLIGSHIPGRLDTWLQPRWEYMHFHPLIENVEVSDIGVAEEGGDIVGVVHPEDWPAFVYFQIHPAADEVGWALLEWAEDHLGGWSHTFGADVLGLWINEDESGLERLAGERGYERRVEHVEEHALLDFVDLVDAPQLPEGFRLQTLAEENDLNEVNRVLWRGFDHGDDPPDEEIPGRRFAQSAPDFRKDLTVVGVSPDGHYVSYCGMWFVPENRVAYVEPVATDPDFRGMGVGTAGVMDALRRVRAEGADLAWVGSGLEFYLRMGFRVAARTRLWVKAR